MCKLTFEQLPSAIQEMSEKLDGLRSQLTALQQSYERAEQDKLVSPAKAITLFDPPVSLPTLSSWEKQGLVTSYRFGGRKFFKLSEILQSAKALKKYKKSFLNGSQQ